MTLPLINRGRADPRSKRGLKKSLVEAELSTSIGQLVRLRWFAGFGVILLTPLIRPLFNVQAPTSLLFGVGVFILVYNLAFFLLARYLRARIPITSGEDSFPSQELAIGQVILDWIGTILLVHYSGGIESPATYFFLFHIVIASIFFQRKVAYAFAVFALFLLYTTAGLEFWGFIPHYTIIGFLDHPLYQNSLFVLGSLIFFGFSAMFITYLVTGIAERLRERAIEVVELSESLQRATKRLQVLNESAHAISSTLEMNEVLNLLVKKTAEVMEVQACSIRLLDNTGQRLEPVAVYGLSEAYVNKGPIVIMDGSLDAKVLSGEIINIPDVSQSSLLQYPEWAISEGYWSMLSMPLVGKNQALGTLRAYSKEKNHFTADDETFLTAIAAQGSSAIENAIAYEAIASLEQTKSTFVRTFTHELRSPVGVIYSLLRNITDGYAGEITPQQRDLVERAIRRTDFLQTLIDDLLDLAAGKMRERTKEVPIKLALNPIIERVLKRHEVLSREKGVNLTWNNPESSSDLMLTGTQEGLDRVFNNLISNAVKYTPKGGSVTIGVEESVNSVSVSIEDTGIGIPEDAMPNLFTEFYRAPNARQIESKGTGLGLTIVKDTVISLDGQISVESKLGEGTRFTVTFPKPHLT